MIRLEERLKLVVQELSTRKDPNEKVRGKFPGIFSYNVGVRALGL